MSDLLCSCGRSRRISDRNSPRLTSSSCSGCSKILQQLPNDMIIFSGFQRHNYLPHCPSPAGSINTFFVSSFCSTVGLLLKLFHLLSTEFYVDLTLVDSCTSIQVFPPSSVVHLERKAGPQICLRYLRYQNKRQIFFQSNSRLSP